MTEAEKIIYTSFTTIIVGVAVITTGKLIEKIVIEPLVKFRETMGLIAYNLIFYADIYTNPEISTREEQDKASNTFRNLSAELSSGLYSLPCYGLLRRLCGLPKYEQISNAGANLIGLSNALYGKDNLDHILKKRESIVTNLKIEKKKPGLARRN